MKKYRLLRQGKQVFAVVLAASLMVTSVTPGAVYASETEMPETVVQTEEATEEIETQAMEESETESNTAAENDEVEVDFQSEDEKENSEKMEVQEDTETKTTVQETNDDAEVSDVNDSDISMFDDDLNALPVAEADNDSETQPFDITVSMVSQLRYGYTSTNQSQIYVSNVTGKIDSNRKCWLEGEDKDAFECYPATSTNSIWYIKPKVGLTAKTYTATLHASYLGEETTKEISLTVLPRTVYVKWGDHEFTYDKKEHVPEVTVNDSGSILQGDTCNLIVKGSQTNAGTYTATVETDNPCYKIYSSQETQSFTINPRPVEFEWDYEDGHVFEYDGNPHTLTATATGVLEGDICNPVYQEMTLDTSTPGTTGPKHCTVTITGVDNSNYTTKHGQQLYVSRAFNVVAKKITKIILNPKKAKQYDGTTTFPTSSSYYDYAEGAFTSKIDGLVGDDKVYVSAIQSQSATLDNKDVGTDKALTLNVYLAGKDKYKYDFTGIQVAGTTIVQAAGTATVDPRPVTLQWDKDKFQYDGKEHTPEATIKNGVLSGENCNVNSITVSGENLTEGKAVNAGTYTATATLDNSNYITKAADKEFIIEKADPALSVSAITDKNYGEEAFKLEISNKGDGQKSYASSDEKVVKVDENGLVTIVGAGKATLTVSLAESANYSAGEKTVTVIVKKVDHKLVVEKLAYEVTYGDKAFKIAASAGDKETDIKFASNDKDIASVSEDGTVTVGNVGTAKITVSMDESQNYLAVAKEVTVTVVPKEIIVTPNDASKVYGDKDGELGYSADDLAGEDTLSGITLTRAEGEDVGTYDITASEEKDANPNYSVKFEKGTFTITQKEIGLSWADTKLTYNGKDQKPSASATGLVGKDTCEVTVTGAMKNAGTYTATATQLSNKNYKLPSEITTEYTIGAKEIGVEWGRLEFTYDGTKKQPTAKATGLVEGDTCGITVSGAAAAAGSHTAKAESVDNANYKLPKDVETEFVINKAETVILQKPESISDLIYTGEAQDLISVGQTEDGKFVYKVNGGKWSETIPSGLDAGTYEISYKVIGDDNHNDSEESKITVTIAKKAVVVSGITAEDKTYDGNTSAVLNYNGVKFNGLLEKDFLSVSAKGTFENKNTGEKKVLISNLALDGASIKNYELAKEDQQNEAVATIHAREITATITPNGGTYEGTIIPASAVLNGLIVEDKTEITLTYTGTANDGTVVGSDGKGSTEAPTHAGTYNVTASITDGNYHLKAEGSSAEFVVAKADPALTVSAAADKNYGEEAFKLETSNKGDGQKSYASSDEKVATVDENGLVTIVGAGAATLAVSLAESANYTASEKTVTVTVKKIDHSLVVEKLAYEVTYGDPSFSVVGQAGDTETAVKYISSNADVASVDENGVVTIKNAGEATITLEMDESGNYNAVSKAVTVTVHPKAVIVTPDNFTKVYDEADPELTYKADGLVGEDTLADIILTRAEGENAGTYDITAEAKEGANPNYSITCEKGTFTITPKPIEKAEVTLGDALKYTGKEQTQNVAKVTLDGKEIPADAYTVENNTATEAGTYTLTIKAKEGGNYTGTFTWTYVIAPTQDSQIKENADGSVKIGDGTLKLQVKTEGGVPSASLVTGKAQIIEMLIQSGDITADELALIAGGASVDIVLTVKDGSATVSAEAKAQMESGANGYTIGQYLDISLFKYMTVNGVTQDGIKLRQTAGQITISVSIPEKLINTDSKVTRTYAVIRNHDGKADVLDTTYNVASQTLTFQANLFSDYAIAYQDVKETEPESETETETKQTESETETETEIKQTETEKKSGTTGTSQTTAAKTGDTTNVAGYGMALLVSAMAVILLMRRKRTEK